MNSLRTFFYSFKRSLTDISYYRDILKAPFSFSFKYFVFLIFITSFFQSLFFSIGIFSILPQAPQFTETLKERIRTAYPPELIINIQDGKLSTNVEEPYYYDIPELTEEDGEFRHLIAIDTTASADDYPDYKSVILVTERSIVYPDNQNGEVQTQQILSLDEIGSFQMNKQIYDGYVREYLPYADYIPTVLTVLAVLGIVLIPFLLTAFGVIGNMIYLLVLAFVMWLISQIFKNNISYGKIYQLGLHALTLPIIATTVINLLQLDISFFYTASFALWMVIILTKIKEIPVPTPPTRQTK